MFCSVEVQPGALSATGAGKGLGFLIPILGGSCDNQGKILVCWSSKRSGRAEAQETSWKEVWSHPVDTMHRADTERCPVLKGWLGICHGFDYSKNSSENARGIFGILRLAVSRDISSCAVDTQGAPDSCRGSSGSTWIWAQPPLQRQNWEIIPELWGGVSTRTVGLAQVSLSVVALVCQFEFFFVVR